MAAKAEKKILVVDDELLVRESLTDLLVAQNFCVEAVESGEMALELAESFQPDLVLLDIMMPKLDGIETLRRLKKRNPDIPVVFATGAVPMDLKQAQAHGADDLILKPFCGEKLGQNLQRVIARAEHQRFPFRKILEPSSVAIIGASEVPGKASERRTRSIIEQGYRGRIYPVNPKRETIFGLPCYPSLKDINSDQIDLAIIALAPDRIPQALADCCALGVHGVIIISAGSRIEGSRQEYQNELRSILAGSMTRVIGPNCNGLFSASANFNCLGLPNMPKGPYSVVAQSGNVIDSLVHYAKKNSTGFSKIVGLGDAVDLQFPESLDILAEDPETKVIMCYIEGIRDGSGFIEACQRAVIKKPVIAIKVGTTEAGQRAAASHTSALSGSEVVADAALYQAGVIRVDNPDEMFAVAQCFASSPVSRGKRVAILSEGGGHNALAADNASNNGLEVVRLSDETQERIRPFLLRGMSAENPIDYGGTAEEEPELIAKCVREVMASGEIDSIYLTGFFGGFSDVIAPHVAEKECRTSVQLAALVEEFKIPLVVHSSYADSGLEAVELLRRSGIPVYESSRRAAIGLSCLYEYSRCRKRVGRRNLKSLQFSRSKEIDEMLQEVRAEGRLNLLEPEARVLLGYYRVPMLNADIARDEGEAARFSKAIGFPVAMKIISPDIIHKSDVGGIRLNILNERAAREAFLGIVESCSKYADSDRFHGVLVSPMSRSGTECIIGISKDPVFGPTLLFGLGGVFVELLKQFSLRVLPLADADFDDMVDNGVVSKLLSGVRGQSRKDVAEVKRLLKQIAQLALDYPEIAELDLNPVFVHERGISVIDARIILDPEIAP